jgi:hypothetical protein
VGVVASTNAVGKVFLACKWKTLWYQGESRRVEPSHTVPQVAGSSRPSTNSSEGVGKSVDAFL